MSYHRWTQFLRQRSSVGLSGAFTAAGGPVYANRSLPSPAGWQNHDRFPMSQNASVTQLTGWQPDNQGVIRIPASLNVPADLIRAVENYGAFLQNLLGQAIAPSAAGTVIYDADLKQIVY